MELRAKTSLFPKLRGLLGNEYAFSVIAKVFGVIAGLVYSVLYSRYLGAELRGEASVVTNTATLVSLFACLGIYQAYPFFRKRGLERPDALYVSYVNKVLGLFFLYLAICALLAAFAPVSSGLKVSFLLIPLLMGVKELNYVVLIERPKLRNSAGVLINLVDIAIVGAMMLFTTANYTLCYLFLIVKELVCFAIAVQNLKLPLFSLRPTLAGIGPYVRFGIIPMITIILMEINYRVDVLMLNGNVSKMDIGIYSLGVQLAERLWLIPDALKDILLSKLSKGKGPDEVAKITRISLFAMASCVMLAILFGKPFILLLFGKEFAASYRIMLVILASIISMVFYKMVYSYNVANGKRMVNMLLLGLAALANVSLNRVLIPRWGNMGAALASLASYSGCGIAFLVYFHMETNVPYSDLLLPRKTDWMLLHSLRGKASKGKG